MKYKMIWDFHSHTTYSHGKGSIEENVIIGMKRGLKKVAITEHGPGHLGFGVSMKKMKEIKEEIAFGGRPSYEYLRGAFSQTARPLRRRSDARITDARDRRHLRLFGA